MSDYSGYSDDDGYDDDGYDYYSFDDDGHGDHDHGHDSYDHGGYDHDGYGHDGYAHSDYEYDGSQDEDDDHFSGPGHDDGHRSCSPEYHEGDCGVFQDQDYDDADDVEIVGVDGFTHVRCPDASFTPHVDWNSIVVAVDGACPRNGRYDATKSASGIYFGPYSRDNTALRVPDGAGYAHTNQRAELYGALTALRLCREHINNGRYGSYYGPSERPTINRVVIKTDSSYVKNGITSHIKTWRENGWRTARGTEVMNQDLWAKLDDTARSTIVETGAAIDFWHVPRDQNQDADALARHGLTQTLRN